MVWKIMTSSWAQAWRRRRRAGRQLLTVELVAAGLRASCWQEQGRLWQEERKLSFDAAEAASWEQAAAALRELLLWRSLPEGAAVVLLLDSGLVYSESLFLPLLAPGELRRTAVWEAEQAAPWKDCCCGYSVLGQDAGELQLRLWAVPSACAARAGALAAELQLSLQGLLAEAEAQSVASSWYGGAAMGSANLLPAQRWGERLAQSRGLRRAAVASLLLSLLLCGGARLGCYLAEQELQGTAAQLEEYAPWQERYAAGQRLEKEIEQLQRLEQSLRTPSAVVPLERLGRLLAADCWLLRVQRDKGQWRIEGCAGGYEELQALLRRLQASQLFAKVSVSSSSGSAGVRFVLQLQEKKS